MLFIIHSGEKAAMRNKLSRQSAKALKRKNKDKMNSVPPQAKD